MPGSKGSPSVYLALPIAEQPLARIASACSVSRFEGPNLPSKEELCASLGRVEGLLGSAMLQIDRQVLESAPRLRVVSNFGVGFDNVDLAFASERGVLVCNTPGVLSDAVADLTMALVLSLARRLPEAERFVRGGEWRPGHAMGLGSDVQGKTLGIIGLGRIGSGVAKRARAFDMRVWHHDVVPQDDGGLSRPVALDELLRESDFVTLHVNLTEETRGLMGVREFALMKRSAYLINTARGQVVDQAALTDALTSGRIAGAALDVFEREPLPADDPLARLPNVILLPHIGSGTKETRAAMLDLAIDNLLTALRGERPQCLVNPEALDARQAGSR